MSGSRMGSSMQYRSPLVHRPCDETHCVPEESHGENTLEVAMIKLPEKYLAVAMTIYLIILGIAVVILTRPGCR